MNSLVYISPFGSMLLTSTGSELVEICLPNKNASPTANGQTDDILAETIRQFDAYFAGELTEFELPLAFAFGTEFQQTVWMELANIPYGTTISYGELAKRVGNPAASRAVGAANGKNPLPIVLPCHRVIGSNGSLTGFGGGLDVKEWLLNHESKNKENHEGTKTRSEHEEELLMSLS